MSDVQEIEMEMEHAKAVIAKKDQLHRLLDNKDFQEFFMTGYLTDYASEMVMRKALLSCQDEKNQRFIDQQITAIGNVRLYMQLIEKEANMAEEALKTHQEERDRALEEEA